MCFTVIEKENKIQTGTGHQGGPGLSTLLDKSSRIYDVELSLIN